MGMSGKVYDVLKFIAQIVLPALGTLYGTIGKIWGLPLVPEIVATIAAIDTFLGALLMIDSHYYYKKKEAVEAAEAAAVEEKE